MRMAAGTTLESEWQEYARGVLPADLSPEEREEHRTRFYCGAFALASLVGRISSTMPPELARDHCGAVQAELKAWSDERAAFEMKRREGR